MFEADPFRVEPVIGQGFAVGQHQKQSCGTDVVHDRSLVAIGGFAEDGRIKGGRSIDILNSQDEVIDEKAGGDGCW
jgi:hypothetical protein